eukprot:6214494-Pleurochrysis_carterae.AAC.8
MSRAASLCARSSSTRSSLICRQKRAECDQTTTLKCTWPTLACEAQQDADDVIGWSSQASSSHMQTSYSHKPVRAACVGHDDLDS